MSISVKFWTPGDGLAHIDLHLLVKSTDIYQFIAEARTVSCVPLAYEISPAIEQSVGLIWVHLRTPENISCRDTGNDNCIERTLFRRFCDNLKNIAEGIYNFCPTTVDIACRDSRTLLNQRSFGDALGNSSHRISLLIEYIADFAREVLQVLESEAPIIHNSPTASKDWWTRQISFAQSAEKYLRRFEKDFGSPIPEGLSGFYIHLSDVVANLRLLQATPPTLSNIVRSLAESSAYCAAIAERCLLRGNTGRSVLLFHRAADLLFFSLCADNNLIDFSRRGGAYRTARPYSSSNLITLKNSMQQLDSVLSSSTARDQCFDVLNSWRNILMETHSMSAPSEDCVRTLLIEARTYLTHLGGSTWSRSVATYSKGFSIPATSIIDPDNKLPDSIKPIFIW